MYDPAWKIPLPKELPLKLDALRDDPSLMEDVWITPAPLEVPRWLEDPDVREGIHAMHRLDQCQEEKRRIELEVENLIGWLAREMTVVDLALKTTSCESCSPGAA